MRALAPVLAALLLPSCTIMHGDTTRGTYTFATIGGNATAYRQSATSASASLDNATAVSKAAEVINHAANMAALKGGIDQLSPLAKTLKD